MYDVWITLDGKRRCLLSDIPRPAAERLVKRLKELLDLDADIEEW